jgi:hypothetical protein
MTNRLSIKLLLLANDLAWLATAVAYFVMDDPPPELTAVVAITTFGYVVDLLVKFRAHGWNPKTCLRMYWLDILLLVPFVKMFRALRIVKVGRLIRGADAACDLTEMACRAVRFVRKIRQKDDIHK